MPCIADQVVVLLDAGFLQLRQMIAPALAAWHAEYPGVVPGQTTAVLRPGHQRD
jgi:hypothetical protein